MSDTFEELGPQHAAPQHAPQQVPVPSETDGYKGPGGRVRGSIRDRIAAARPFVHELVEIPEWDATIEVRSLTLGARQEMMVDLMGDDDEMDKAAVEAAYIMYCSFDPETGERIFADDDLQFIQSRDSGSMDKIGVIAMRLSGNASLQPEEAQEVEAKK